ncbi:hypothetical protein CH063_15217 [Colletotrichum higginsianum]|uniref:Uncharacterized protein n=2 Tax=Colletotrichum higginsianum TaxID=80884 RepID=H1W1X0_COLHI|nr:hypothetical protein CH63R_03927 [Colletotrichum higginsianum IMI 349063]OBR11631.1 hypothetical protein CH63R_03927 [Colletotrichum higginsianum IMI 349063]TIC99345.1 hypothetical protein CH35J_006191 [Colletotrichum higginsianum]GJC93292.1 hypothetical protein ColKHC_02118 [Colletotrichum higginsianum]CCF46483.1 hypothetical protein CH063_15217 [Colletotrichum higginsianum]
MISIVKLSMVAFAGAAAASPLAETATPTQSGECTFTVTELDAGFTGDFQPTATITLYGSTVTVPKPVDCHGCNHVTTTREIAPWWGGIGPQIAKVIYVSATTPTTVSTWACATSSPSPTDVPGLGPSK